MNWPDFIRPRFDDDEVIDQRSYRDVTAGDGVVKFKTIRWWWTSKDFHSIEAWLRDGKYVHHDKYETCGATMSLENESIFLIGAPASCIEAMVHAYPNGNHHHRVMIGYYALHRFLLLANNRPAKEEKDNVFRVLIRASPQAAGVRHPDRDMLPLHIVCTKHAPTMGNIPFQQLLDAYPEAARTCVPSRQGGSGDLPLHKVCQLGQLSIEQFTALVQSYEEGLQQGNINGETPVEVLIDYFYRAPKRARLNRFAYMKFMMLHFSRSTTQKQTGTHLVPFMFTAVKGHLDLTFELLVHFVAHRNLNIFVRD
jgi:hypothetical protein